MTKRFSTVYNVCQCSNCGCEFECWGQCPDVCDACESAYWEHIGDELSGSLDEPLPDDLSDESEV